MQDEPDGGEHLPGDGDLNLHAVLPADDGLVIAEAAIERTLRTASSPRALDESFPQVLVSVSDLS